MVLWKFEEGKLQALPILIPERAFYRALDSAIIASILGISIILTTDFQISTLYSIELVACAICLCLSILPDHRFSVFFRNLAIDVTISVH